MRRSIFFIAGTAALVLLVSFFIFFGRIKNTIMQGKNNASAQALLTETRKQTEEGKLLQAREACQKLIKDYPQSKDVMECEKLIWEINIKLLFSQTPAPDSKIYEVQPQDTLVKIARNFRTTVDLIMKANNLKSDVIRPGMKLKVSTAKFTILVDKSQNTLTLKSNDDILKVYQVATGLENSTPVGTFKIINKIIDPPWYKAGAIVPPGSPKNILGTRWLGFSIPGYGIHGTTEPESIGKQITAGCVRMVNQDVEELYAIVPQGTEVTIVD